MRITQPSFLVLAFAITLPASPAALNAPFGQNPQQSTAPTLHVYSRETIVDVTVTDKDGKPVRGLTRADFSVTEDEKPQPIRSFQEFNRATPAAAAMPRKLPPNTYTNVETGTGPLYVLLDAKPPVAAQFIKNLVLGTRIVQLESGGRLTVLRGTSAGPTLRPGIVIGHDLIKIPPGLTGCTKQVLLDWRTLDMLNQLATYLSGIPCNQRQGKPARRPVVLPKRLQRRRPCTDRAPA